MDPSRFAGVGSDEFCAGGDAPENKARVPTPVIDTSLPNNFPATVASTMSP
jgi:hypothetical protein